MVNPGYPNVIAARFDDDNAPTDLGMDDTSKSLNVNLRIWNPSSLTWERMQQPQIAPLADDLPLDQRFTNNPGGTLKYKSIHATHDAATSDTGWLNYKYTWTVDSSAGLLTRIEGPLEGSIDNIDSLGWGT